MTYGHTSTDANSLADKLQASICTAAAAGRESYAIRHTKRRVDRAMKSVGLEAKTLGSLQSEFARTTGGVNIPAIYSGALANLDKAVAAKDADTVLQLFDNKAMLGEAAKLLATTKRGLEEHIGRMLQAPHGEPFRAALVALLPIL
jgi:phage-related protein